MRKSILLFVLFALLNIPLMLFAQSGYKVKGHVVSAEDNEPMVGVSILEKGTTNGVINEMVITLLRLRVRQVLLCCSIISVCNHRHMRLVPKPEH